MKDISLLVKTIDGDVSISKTISGVNPAVTMTQINDASRKLISLTTHTYVDTVRVTKESVNEAIAEQGD